MDVAALLTYLPALLLHFVRTASFFLGVPTFGVQSDSKMLRIVLAISLGTIFWWVGDKTVPATGVTAFAGLVVREALIGLAIGLGVRIMLSALTSAGEILSHEMGFAMARVVNPATGRSAPVTSQLFEIMAFLLIFELDIHHEMIRVLGSVYDVIPVGSEFDAAPVAERLGLMVGDALEYGLRYAIPVLGVMVLLTVVLVLLGRAVPNINLMEFSFALRILLAIFASIYFLAEGAPFLEGMFHDMLDKTRGLFVGA